jgi:hypothetical protein
MRGDLLIDIDVTPPDTLMEDRSLLRDRSMDIPCLYGSVPENGSVLLLCAGRE